MIFFNVYVQMYVLHGNPQTLYYFSSVLQIPAKIWPNTEQGDSSNMTLPICFASPPSVSKHWNLKQDRRFPEHIYKTHISKTTLLYKNVSWLLIDHGCLQRNWENLNKILHGSCHHTNTMTKTKVHILNHAILCWLSTYLHSRSNIIVTFQARKGDCIQMRRHNTSIV